MTNKLVVINSLKVPKLKKKCTIWNEISCTKLQLPPEPLTRGLLTPDPHSFCPLFSTEFVELLSPTPRTKFLSTSLMKEIKKWVQEDIFTLNFDGHFLPAVGKKEQTRLHSTICDLPQELSTNKLDLLKTLKYERESNYFTEYIWVNVSHVNWWEFLKF